MSPVKVVAIDDHPIVLDGIRNLLATEEDLELVGTTSSGWQGVQLVADAKPDVVVLDLRLAGRSAPEVCRALRAVAPETQVLIFTAFDDLDAIDACRRYGARGVVTKDSDDLAEAIRAVSGDGVWPPTEGTDGPSKQLLTPRETDVLMVLAQGLTSRQIATELGLSYNTVRGYVQSLLQKLGSHNRVEVLAVARRLGLI